jgi:hypothetical protein
MNVDAKLALLERLVVQRTSDGTRLRLSKDISRCRAVITMRDRVLSRHLITPEAVWLYELASAGDEVASAWFIFLESLQCELGCRGWTPSGVDSAD